MLSPVAGSALGRSAPLEQTDDERMTDPAAPLERLMVGSASGRSILPSITDRKIYPAAPLELSSMAGPAFGRSAPLE